jgi:hypothetical protein
MRCQILPAYDYVPVRFQTQYPWAAYWTTAQSLASDETMYINVAHPKQVDYDGVPFTNRQGRAS